MKRIIKSNNTISGSKGNPESFTLFANQIKSIPAIRIEFESNLKSNHEVAVVAQ